MQWNWQRFDWPNFRYDAGLMAGLEAAFLSDAGHVAGAFSHLAEDDRDELRIELLSDEALETSRSHKRSRRNVNTTMPRSGKHASPTKLPAG